MPIYEYRCDNDHSFEVMQRMSHEPLLECTVCGAPVQRVFHPVAVHFKGKGFYTTDYGKAAASGDGKVEASSDSEPEKSESKKSDSTASKDGGADKSSTKSAAAD